MGKKMYFDKHTEAVERNNKSKQKKESKYQPEDSYHSTLTTLDNSSIVLDTSNYNNSICLDLTSATKNIYKSLNRKTRAFKASKWKAAIRRRK